MNKAKQKKLVTAYFNNDVDYLSGIEELKQLDLLSFRFKRKLFFENQKITNAIFHLIKDKEVLNDFLPEIYRWSPDKINKIFITKNSVNPEGLKKFLLKSPYVSIRRLCLENINDLQTLAEIKSEYQNAAKIKGNAKNNILELVDEKISTLQKDKNIELPKDVTSKENLSLEDLSQIINSLSKEDKKNLLMLCID
ncbi:MAG: hypothetical protein N4A44_04260 [Alphaproteobacteria bacterium]|jgi:hypothetical protein|nr:hypothetical protein [Alphaproteobacteria bacterium]